MSRRAPRPLAMALGPLRDALAPATLLAEVQRVWPEVAGAAIAREAAPTAVRGGVLTIACSASVWAQELDLMAPLLLERLNERLTGGEIDRLRCLTGGPGGPPGGGTRERPA
jgi:predicted nucleic acid-binding Zn ribbon protein